MYINIEILQTRNLSLLDLSVLQIAKKAKLENVSSVLSFYPAEIKKLKEKGYIEEIKGTKNQTELQKIRASKLGVETLDLISTPLITDGDIQMYNYLCDLYLNEDSTRVLGNRKAGLRYCSEYRQIMGFTLHEMYWLCVMFVNNVTFTKVLEYVFFSKKENPYGKFKDNLDSSKIHQFWCDNEYEIREFWAEKIKTDENNNQ